VQWGSSRSGALFTGTKRWRVTVERGHIALSVNGAPDVGASLLQLRSISFEPGTIWATCHFDVQNGTEVVRHTVDGIPNQDAQKMKAGLESAAAITIATFVEANKVSLEAWVDRAAAQITPQPGAYVVDNDIRKSLASSHAPATPGDIPWSSVLRHGQAAAARGLGRTWPKWDGAPEQELTKRFHTHNKASFQSAFKKWGEDMQSVIGRGRWIPKGAPARILKRYPPPVWPGRSWQSVMGTASPDESLRTSFAKLNSKHLVSQREARKQFFDTVEANPLTPEQVDACICMDDAVMVVAAAGSGKTSTMVAKTGYALHEKLATPDQILLLAFNRSTADELTERISVQLRGVPDVEQVRSNTFHAFGIEVIGKATGKKPSLAPWVDPSKGGADLKEIINIVDSLGAGDPTFKREWDLFRTVYGRDIGKWGQRQQPEAYGKGRVGFRTANGEIVKSGEERVICDWLFYNGVTYEYERAFEHETASESHRQYVPDFYYPDADLYHEHFALNAKGEAPKEFKGYLRDVEWKRQIHAEKGTALFETTSHGIMTGEAFKLLERALMAKGITPRFDAERIPQGVEPVPQQDIARVLRIFQQHVKNNGLTHAQLLESLKKQSVDGFAARLRMFLGIYERVSAEWERRLRQGNYIDFEDMLIQAAGHTESGAYKSPYTIILADEFQDSSRARMRLLKALAANPDSQTHLCVVGDDWQGINRFAGSDISVMTEFEKDFENSTRLTLNTTFRCPQAICDVSSEFIQANPAQIRKTVATTNPLTKAPMLAFGFDREEGMHAHIEKRLERMYGFAEQGDLKPAKGQHISVMLLGRYRHDEPPGVGQWKGRFGDRLRIDFRTVHGSKGLEAEYVFVLNVIQGTHGFPSQIQDDPALQLAMPEPDPHPFAEERRLFYVAMTRARKQVIFYTKVGSPSQFLVELTKAGRLTIKQVDGDPLEPCPKCGAGVLQARLGQFGTFFGCSRFPGCDFKRDAQRGESATLPIPQKSSRIRGAVKAGDQCPICRRGIIRLVKGKNGPFLGCSRFREGCRATADA